MKKLQGIIGGLVVVGAFVNESLYPFLDFFTENDKIQTVIKIVGVIIAFLSKSPLSAKSFVQKDGDPIKEGGVKF